MTLDPQHDHYVRTLNRDGFLFQKKIQHETEQIIENIVPELPVEYGQIHHKLDLLAETSSKDKRLPWRAFFLIDAKRHLSDYTTWLFLTPEHPRSPPPPYLIGYGVFSSLKEVDVYSSIDVGMVPTKLHLSLVKQEFDKFSDGLEYGNIPFEIRSGSDKAKNDAIAGVCNAVTIATHAMAIETVNRSRKSGKDGVENRAFFIPIVVTTAKLKLAEASANDIPLTTGMIEPQNLRISDEKWLVYEHSLPGHLLLPMEASNYTWDSSREDRLRRRHIFIVNAEHYSEFLQKLRGTEFTV